MTPNVVFAVLIGGGFIATYIYFFQDRQVEKLVNKSQSVSSPGNYQQVKKDIANDLERQGYDDGSLGPLLVRLAWHASGTFDKDHKENKGGSDGATMRFQPEREHPQNAGLEIAMAHLEGVKQKHPWISYADLWTLAGCVAVEEMGGPEIAWRPGRTDDVSGVKVVKEERLPGGDEDASRVRKLFYRMGLSDQEIVALSGAHSLGRCHTDRSGYSGPWTNAPTTFSNLYFQELLNTKWTKKKWDGPEQYEDPTKELMMLPSDMCLVWDKGFKKYVEMYAKDDQKFFKDFAKVYNKLLELGVNFQPQSA